MPNLDLPIRLKRAEELRTIYREEPKAGVSLDELMTAAYWVNVVDRLRVFDRVEVVAQDGSYFAEIELVMKKPGEMKWRVWWQETAAPVPIAQPVAADFFAQPAGRGTFRVVQKSTGKMIAEGLDKASADAEAERLNGTLAKAA